MNAIKKLLTVLYFFVCPCELVLNVMLVSSTKYVGLLILIFWAIESIYNWNYSSIRLTASTISLLIWLAICILCLAWGDSSSETSGYLTTYLEMGLLVIVLTQTDWSERDVNHFLLAYFLGSICLTILFFIFGETRYTVRATIVFMGREIDPNQVAANIVPGAVISLGYIINKNLKMPYRIISAAAFLLTVYTTFLTGSRGGLVSLAAGMLFVYFPQLKELDIKKVLVLCVSIVLVWYSISLLPEGTSERLLGFSTYTDKYDNGQSRLTLWKDMFDDFDAQWFIGHGVGSSITFFQMLKGTLQGVHNTFLLVLYEVGIIGFCFWLFPYIAMLFYNISRRNHVIAGVLIAALLSSFFLDALIVRYIWNALILSIMKYDCDEEFYKASKQIHACKYIRDCP
ncbi:MAG: O-antigen ligase family protein [Clostridia bacterium]|nr:O-antigen ligase family protein [Clostridia bacterium]